MNMFKDLLKWRGSRKAKLHESFQAVFTTPSGEQVLQHICDIGFVFRTTHVTGDPYQSSVNEGKRMLALGILKFVKTEHKDVLEMIDKQIKTYE